MRYVINDLSIDTEARTVSRGESVVKLSDLSFNVLVKLIEAAPDPVSTTTFSNTVWHNSYVSDETIAQRITLLRKALGDDPKEPVYIRTARGLGYAIASPVVLVNNSRRASIIAFLKNRYSIATATGLTILLLSVALFSPVHNSDSIAVTTIAKNDPASATAILVKRARQQLDVRQSSETDRAITLLREALSQDPTHFDARLTLSFALSTKITKFGGNDTETAEAETIARALISEQPDNSDAWVAFGYAVDSQGRINESLPAYQYAYQLNPDNASALSSAAYLHLIQGNLHQALLLETRARRVGGTSRYTEIQIAQSLELIGHPAAANWQSKAMLLNPGQVVVLGEIAKSYLRNGNPEAALEILAQAKGADQSAQQILQLRGRAATMLGNLDEAQTLLETSGDWSNFEMAALNAVTGDTSLAEALLHPKKLVELETNATADARVYLAEIAATLGRNEQALQFLAQAINLGWRDNGWLKHSPFLRTVMSSDEGQQLAARIARELDAQRLLIETTAELAPLLNS